MTAWLIETLVATTLLMLVVLVLREPVARHFGARIAYLLWLAPALRMILPPVPQSWLAAKMPAVETMTFAIADAPVSMSAATADVAPAFPWGAAILAFWAVGAAGFFLWHALSYWRFARAVRGDSDALFDEGAVAVSRSGRVASPLAFGIFGKRVVVPVDFDDRYTPVERGLALRHELTHHRRGDLIVNLGALAMLSLHWFNPLAHRAFRAFRLDQEAACDALVLDGAAPDERAAYGAALVKSATGGVPLAACSIGAARELKARLRRMVIGSVDPARIQMGAAATVVLVLAGLGGTASGVVVSQATEPVVRALPPLAMTSPKTAAPVVETRFAALPVEAPRRAPAPRIARIAPIPATPPAATVATPEPAEAPAPVVVAAMHAGPALVRFEVVRAVRLHSAHNHDAHEAGGAKGDCPDAARKATQNDARIVFSSRAVILRRDAEPMTLTAQKATLDALLQVRGQIATLREIDAERRAHALQALDAQIERLRARGTTLT
jgi:bla regulator protein blaR1